MLATKGKAISVDVHTLKSFASIIAVRLYTYLAINLIRDIRLVELAERPERFGRYQTLRSKV